MFMTFDCLTLFEQTHLTREKIVVVVVVKIKKKTPNFLFGHTPFVCLPLRVASFVERAASFFLSFLYACERRRKQ